MTRKTSEGESILEEVERAGYTEMLFLVGLRWSRNPDTARSLAHDAILEVVSGAEAVVGPPLKSRLLSALRGRARRLGLVPA